jgi:HAD superfamily hydrolase (TIGR01484 family)
MIKRLLISDLDDTFLNKDGTLPINTNFFINNLKKKNIDFAIATSRPPQSVKELFKDQINDKYALCNDGSIFLKYKENNIKVIQEYSIEKDILDELQNKILPLIIEHPLFLFGDSLIDFEIGLFKIKYSKIIINKLFPLRKKFIIEDKKSLKDTLIKNSFRAVSLFGEYIEMKNIYNILINIDLMTMRIYFYKETRFFNAKYFWIDIIPAYVSKGFALNRMKKEMNYMQIYALGNGINDMELFEGSDISICPSNSIDEIKKIATYVLSTNCGEKFLEDVQKIIKK